MTWGWRWKSNAEQINQRRQQLCEQIEQEAIAHFEQSQIDLQQERVLVIVQPNWHHGVIGIVASRLVDRYVLCSSEPMKMSNTFVAQRGRISCI